MTIDCPQKEKLSELFDESLPDSNRLTLEQHIETCIDCQSWLDSQSQNYVGHFKAASIDVPPNALERWLSPSILTGLQIGSRLGPYRIDAIIGRGGMGIVYRAMDEKLNRFVALKVLTSNLTPDAAARFVREIQAVARVRHEHVIEVFAAVDATDKTPAYLVMEYVDGLTLRQAAAEARGLDPRRAAEITAQIADALSAAHSSGLVHRDVKPSNVLIDNSTGRAKLADFGLARASDAAQLTHSGMVMGTPSYMAPEQVSNPTAATAISDVYSLGATLYEAMTGVEPFRGSIELVIAQVMRDEPISPRQLKPSVPSDLETVCLKAMSKEPAIRYQSATAMRDDLNRWLSNQPVLARPVGWFGRLKRWSKRNPTAAMLASALSIAMIVSFVTVTWLWLNSENSAKLAQDNAAVAKAEKAKADQDYRAAEKVVDLFYQRLYDRGSVAAAINIETRLELIREAITFYEQVAARRPGDKPPAELAVAYARKGMLHNLLKETEPASASFRSALALFEQAEQDGPVSDNCKREHAECLFYLGVSAGRSRDAKGAMTNYEAAIARLIPLATSDPQASYFLAGSLGNLAGVYEYLGDVEKARATHEKAMPVYRQTRTANPKNGGALQDLIWTTLSIARLQPDPKVSLDQLTVAQSLVEEYGREQPTDYNRADVGCSYHTELTLAYLRVGNTEKALQASEKALEMAKTMAEFPPQFRHLSSQAAAWRAEAMARDKYGDRQAAVAAWTKSAEIYESFDWNALGSATFKNNLARIYDSLAADAATQGNTMAAEVYRKKSADTRERLKKEHPAFKPGG